MQVLSTNARRFGGLVCRIELSLKLVGLLARYPQLFVHVSDILFVVSDLVGEALPQ